MATRLLSAIVLALALLTLTSLCFHEHAVPIHADFGPVEAACCGSATQSGSSTTNDQNIGPQGSLLRSFTATVALDHVVVEWETIMEIGLGGFDVERSRERTGPYSTVNPARIPPQHPGSSVGAAYTYTDTTVSGGTSWYRLAISKTWGIDWSQPVAVTLHRVHLPLVLR